MRTSNERNNIGIIGIILLIANWFFVFGINSYMYDHRNENSGLLPFIWEMVAVIIGFTALSACSRRYLKHSRMPSTNDVPFTSTGMYLRQSQEARSEKSV